MKEITTKDLKKLIDANADFVLLDCRSQHYFNWEHIPGAKNLRWKYVDTQAEKLFPDKKTLIITYCDGFTCNASVRCFQNLQKAGYTNLIEYSGGIADWLAHGLPTTDNPKYKIASNVYRFPDQEFYGEAVGSYMVVEEDFLLLVDGPQQLTEEIVDFIRHQDKPVKFFMSHSPTAGEAKRLQQEFGAKVYLHEADKKGEWLTVSPDVFIKDGFRFNDHLSVFSTPGHTPGSSVIFDSNNKLLFSGDHVEGDKQGKIYDFVSLDDGYSGDVKQRLLSAKKLLRYDFAQILPFHYEMIRKDAKKALRDFVEKHNKQSHK